MGAPSLQPVAKTMEMKIKQKNLGKALKDRPEKEALANAGYLPQEGMAASLQGTAQVLEHAIKKDQTKKALTLGPGKKAELVKAGVLPEGNRSAKLERPA